jgi:RecA-family ATPase
MTDADNIIKLREADRVRHRLVPFADVSLSTEREYLIKGLLPRTGLALVWGPRKCGKSFWIMDAALHVSLGWQYRGRKVQQVPVVYLALEGHGGYPKRIEAFKQHHGVTVTPFYLVSTKIDLAKSADQLIQDIEAQLSEQTIPGLVVIDTLNRSLVGSESKDEDIAAYLQAASKIEETFKCLVVIIHHCGYDETHPRGHTALV